MLTDEFPLGTPQDFIASMTAFCRHVFLTTRYFFYLFLLFDRMDIELFHQLFLAPISNKLSAIGGVKHAEKRHFGTKETV
ncbi:hypothetical protein [Anoxynatronum sibiricum]|uniref:hypothetical protein n=1 Tax=Anoxynatronum sibiricum TaxID=210623 RepID=UPI0031B805E9